MCSGFGAVTSYSASHSAGEAQSTPPPILASLVVPNDAFTFAGAPPVTLRSEPAMEVVPPYVHSVLPTFTVTLPPLIVSAPESGATVS